MSHAPTPAEAKLRPRLEALGFVFQEPIQIPKRKVPGSHGFIMDNYHPVAMLRVEVDGGYHKRQKGRDRRRDTILRLAGIRTIRFSNKEVLHGLDNVVEKIREELQGGNNV